MNVQLREEEPTSICLLLATDASLKTEFLSAIAQNCAGVNGGFSLLPLQFVDGLDQSVTILDAPLLSQESAPKIIENCKSHIFDAGWSWLDGIILLADFSQMTNSNFAHLSNIIGHMYLHFGLIVAQSVAIVYKGPASDKHIRWCEFRSILPVPIDSIPNALSTILIDRGAYEIVQGITYNRWRIEHVAQEQFEHASNEWIEFKRPIKLFDYLNYLGNHDPNEAALPMDQISCNVLRRRHKPKHFVQRIEKHLVEMGAVNLGFHPSLDIVKHLASDDEEFFIEFLKNKQGSYYFLHTMEWCLMQRDRYAAGRSWMRLLVFATRVPATLEIRRKMPVLSSLPKILLFICQFITILPSDVITEIVSRFLKNLY